LVQAALAAASPVDLLTIFPQPWLDLVLVQNAPCLSPEILASGEVEVCASLVRLVIYRAIWGGGKTAGDTSM
jgi:hypothetical protein